MNNAQLVLPASLALIAVLASLAVVYARFAPARSTGFSMTVSALTAALGAAAWLSIAPLVAPGVVSSPLYVPIGLLGAIATMIASLAVRSGSGSLITTSIFALSWAILVSVPVEMVTFFTGLGGVVALDYGGSLIMNVAAGAAVAGVLLIGVSRPRGLRAIVLPQAWVVVAVVVLMVGWIGWLVAGELAIDDLSTAILVNGALGVAGGVTGWLAVQRMSHQSTTWGGLLAGVTSGLIAVTAGAPIISPLAAVSFGMLAGGAACIATVRWISVTRQPQWYLVGSHLIAGAVGVVLIGILASGTGFVFTGQILPVQNQLFGSIAVAAYSGVVAMLLWLGLRTGERAIIRRREGH
ncbi:Amt family ammonium transporter [Microbacteriaceae bacterium SG_E_30_P1]|uniref:Amt family ammonium transporter n=1 Tax=Antiquaquibacter oligotrophicus TaxID=2880260 RepID=A0ABT6KLX4_9MICO|nr:hypothetical protein [Antiquaquibacter oligotrophicus]MDH6181019.1 Amt family ammonium transporter [Antiquaquibacter oligotrophicus]UDF13282.1 hypothetical protein LH407_14155 [Antiquaquibacter oligotrophicus]